MPCGARPLAEPVAACVVSLRRELAVLGVDDPSQRPRRGSRGRARRRARRMSTRACCGSASARRQARSARARSRRGRRAGAARPRPGTASGELALVRERPARARRARLAIVVAARRDAIRRSARSARRPRLGVAALRPVTPARRGPPAAPPRRRRRSRSARARRGRRRRATRPRARAPRRAAGVAAAACLLGHAAYRCSRLSWDLDDTGGRRSSSARSSSREYYLHLAGHKPDLELEPIDPATRTCSPRRRPAARRTGRSTDVGTGAASLSAALRPRWPHRGGDDASWRRGQADLEAWLRDRGRRTRRIPYRVDAGGPRRTSRMPSVGLKIDAARNVAARRRAQSATPSRGWRDRTPGAGSSAGRTSETPTRMSVNST